MAKTGTGRTYQQEGSDVWWLDYSFRGKRHRESSGSKRKGEAVALLRRRLEEMGRGKLAGPTEERVTFEDLADMITTDYQVNDRKSIASLGFALKHLRGYFGMSRALDISTDRIKKYIQARRAEGAANSTIQGELAALKRAFNLAVQAERLSSRPHVPSVKVSNARQGFFDTAELERVIAELPEAEAAVVRFAGLTGWRKGEILPLQWHQVDFEGGVVRLEPGTTKNDEARNFPFRVLPPLAELLEAQRERTREVERATGRIVPYVFHRQGKRIAKMDGTWRSACKRAGMEGWIFHDLRRTAVRNLERAGVPRSVAMKLTGHKTEAVYRRYAIADHAALSEGVEKLARLHATSEPRTVLPINRVTA